ncbi:sodium:solute symporter family protein [Caproiciproducens sp. NJN-50]|uniref:sodium:solute symporter family protein n=1 Tax=Acutalibacteraceae TaxID=3082771 RepID=UPI000FFE1921|nr:MULTISPECIES: sodium:solute symporter family protein [Acutalibacteraceae]QAT48371.1 sodium:solute symporter family protein [Caproiciproducens sp. NJN-50]
MNLLHFAGAAAVLLLITAVGVYSGRKVKSAADFATGGCSAGTGIVAGSLVGTLVGGASTIGTAQLAFTYGFSAWWFTLGGGIGLLLLALFFAKPLYNSKITTLPQIFTREYGRRTATVSTVLISVGTFLSIVSQLLSGVALVTSVSSVNALAAAAVIVLLMLAYVVFGGVWGAGLVGIVKTILLYVTTIVCGAVALKLAGGLDSLRSSLRPEQYFNLFARGVWKDGGAGLSMVFGILTTQSYVQSLVSAKSARVAKSGALLAGVLTPVIGVAGIFVGMYMRIAAPDIVPASAMPAFVLRCLPPLLGGVVLATLLVALVGTGAGLALGLSSMICNDIYKVYMNRNAADNVLLRISRTVIFAILGGAFLFTFGNMGSLILNWSFLSMGLRGAVAFAPLLFALFFPGRVKGTAALAAVIAGPICILAGEFVLPEQIDPLFLGIGVSLCIMLFQMRPRAEQEKVKTEDKG